mmetsp:Transcript_16169/g.47989  ORF Transcript_16169/g.47989 Transcript_16169/m.47989 type:complete len:214 (-) Transcript_16169:217-858(-)
MSSSLNRCTSNTNAAAASTAEPMADCAESAAYSMDIMAEAPTSPKMERHSSSRFATPASLMATSAASSSGRILVITSVPGVALNRKASGGSVRVPRLGPSGRMQLSRSTRQTKAPDVSQPRGPPFSQATCPSRVARLTSNTESVKTIRTTSLWVSGCRKTMDNCSTCSKKVRNPSYFPCILSRAKGSFVSIHATFSSSLFLLTTIASKSNKSS